MSVAKRIAEITDKAKRARLNALWQEFVATWKPGPQHPEPKKAGGVSAKPLKYTKQPFIKRKRS